MDHSDLTQTDFPSNIPLPSRLYLSEDQKEHENIREWVLAISMDQKIDQVTPVHIEQKIRDVNIFYQIVFIIDALIKINDLIFFINLLQ